MTYAQAQRAGEVLKALADRNDPNLLDWLALVEDRLRTILPADSQLLARFLSLKVQLEPKPLGTTDVVGQAPLGSTNAISGAHNQMLEQDFRRIVLAARDLVTTFNTEPAPTLEPAPKPDLEQEVSRIIQKGYFESWPFRLVLGALALLGLLITGVAGFKLYDQVQAAQRLVDDARKQVETSREQVALAKTEITNRKAELALLVLQGNEELLTMRVKAVGALEDSKRSYVQELDERKKQLVSGLDDAANKNVKSVDEQTGRLKTDLQHAADIGQRQLTDSVQATIRGLAPSKSPWVPVVVWTGVRWGLVLLLTLGLSLSAWINSAIAFAIVNKRKVNLALVANVVLLIAVVGLIYWRA